jgi:hypothetical protein
MSRVAVIGAATAVAVLAAPVMASASGPPPTPPAWREVRVPGPAYGVLTSVTAPAWNAAWAVGVAAKRGERGTGYLLRWNGKSWQERPMPVTGFESLLIRSSSPSNVWTFGTTGSSVDEALRWNGHRWLTIPEPAALGDSAVTAALVLGPRNVWVGDYHWNGTGWTQVPLPSTFAMTQIVGVTGRGNVLAAGTTGSWPHQHVAAYRLVNGSWRWVRIPHPAGFTAFAAAQSADSVFITAAHNYGDGSTVLHWDGERWRTLPAPPSPVSIDPVAAYGRDGLWVGSDDLWNGRTWLTVFGPGDQIMPSGSDIVAIPGTLATWMVGGWCAGPAPCARPVQVMINGALRR